MNHTPTLDELAESDPELRNYLATTRMRLLSGMEWGNLFLSEQEAPRCPCCEKPNDGTVAIRRQNTAYVDDVNNWIICCRDCYDEAEEYWAEAWADYYSMVM